MTAVTQWFGEKPQKVGVYETGDGYGDERAFAYFDGIRFGYRAWADGRERTDDAIQRAYKNRDLYTNLSALPRWRGLAEEPK